MTDSTVVEVLAQCEAKLMRLMDSVEGDQATQELEAQVKFLDPPETIHARSNLQAGARRLGRARRFASRSRDLWPGFADEPKNPKSLNPKS